jgi:hypothetical protein
MTHKHRTSTFRRVADSPCRGLAEFAVSPIRCLAYSPTRSLTRHKLHFRRAIATCLTPSRSVGADQRMAG